MYRLWDRDIDHGEIDMERALSKRVKMMLTAALMMLAIVIPAGGTVYAESSTPPDNGLPVLYLNIDESKGTIEDMNTSTDHSVYCYGTLSIDAPDGFRYSDMDTDFGDLGPIDMNIRGRGNSTWTRYAKRPYKIKLDTKTDLLQRGDAYKNKHWVLVANASDATLLKDRITAWLADEMEFEFTPRGVPVDVVMTGTDPEGEFCEGKYIGSYYLSENVRVDNNRLNIEELEAGDSELPKITGGYLVQNSSQVRVDSPDRFTTKRFVGWATHTPSFDTETDGHALTGQLGDTGEDIDNEDIFNDPDPKEVGADGVLTGDAYENEAQQQYIQEHMQLVEDALFADGTGYRDLMDIESAAKYWLINMFSGNHDAFGTGSTYIYKHRDEKDSVGKMFWGPVWDFDYAWYYDADPYSKEIFTGHEWMEPMFYDRGEGGYVQEIKKQWAAMKPLLQEIAKDGGILDKYCAETKASAIADRQIWRPEDDTFDYEGRIKSFKEWINNRIAWMDENIDSVDNMVHRIHFISDGETWENFYPPDGGRMDADPEQPVKEGYIFLGWKDENGKEYDRNESVTSDRTFTAEFIPESEATQAQDIAFRKAGDVLKRNPRMTGCTIEYTLIPEDAQDKRVEWTSSDESFATIDNEGNVRFVNTGEGTRSVTFTARLSSGVTRDYTLSFIDGDSDFPVPESISPEKSAIEMSVGGQAAFNITTQPAIARIDTYAYDSDDEAVVKVDPYKGVLTAVGPGETKVRVTVTASGSSGEDIELDTFVTVKVSAEQPEPEPSPEPTPEPEPSPEPTPAPDAEPAPAAETVVLDTSLPVVSIRKPLSTRTTVTARWKKLSKKAKKKIQGIEIQIKGPGKNKIVKAKKKKTTAMKFKRLSRKKTYKVRVRTYKVVDGVKHVSKWSRYRKIKTK